VSTTSALRPPDSTAASSARAWLPPARDRSPRERALDAAIARRGAGKRDALFPQHPAHLVAQTDDDGLTQGAGVELEQDCDPPCWRSAASVCVARVARIFSKLSRNVRMDPRAMANASSDADATTSANTDATDNRCRPAPHTEYHDALPPCATARPTPLAIGRAVAGGGSRFLLILEVLY